MPAFTPDQWLIVALAFLLGLFLGMAFLAGSKWKRRYREEVARREEVEAENARLRRDAGEMESLRHAAAKDEARHDRHAGETAEERRIAERRVAERRAGDVPAASDDIAHSRSLRDKGGGPI